jgi:hypothetical protein
MGKPKWNQDRTLVPVAVAGRLGIGVSMLAGWMRAAGVDKDGPLCESDAREWRANPDSAPGWLRPELLATCKAREQRNLSRRQAEARRAGQHREDVYAARGLVCELLRDCDRMLRQGRWLDRHPIHEEALREIAWRAAKDCGLASGREPDFTYLSFEEREALRIFGYQVPEPVGRHLRVVS